MSARLRMSVGVAAAGLACLVMGYAWAQQQEQPEAERPDARQIDRPPTEDAQQIDIDRPVTEEAREYRAEFRAEPGVRQDQELKHYLANRLIAFNKAEIAIYDLAQERAASDQVQQFARDAAEDHRQLVQQLQQLAGKEDRPGLGARQQQQEQRGQLDAQRQQQQQQQAQQPGQLDAERQRQQQAHHPIGAAPGRDQTLKQLTKIDRQVAERMSEAMREELQQHEGAEFDQAFLGAQIVSHIHMKAALEVLAQQGPDELQQVAQQARSDVEQHLQQAQQLKRQLDEPRRPGVRAERDPAQTR